MYLSRVTCHTLPGKIHGAEQNLMTLLNWVENAGGVGPRVMRIHFGSLGALDLIFEQEIEDPATLELQIKQVTENREFQQWAKQVSALLEQFPKRELYQINRSASRVIAIGESA